MLPTLWFLTCLATNPTHCVLRQIQFDPEEIDTPMKCLKVAQPAMARWQDEHLDRWRIGPFRCGKPPRDDGRRI